MSNKASVIYFRQMDTLPSQVAIGVKKSQDKTYTKFAPLISVEAMYIAGSDATKSKIFSDSDIFDFFAGNFKMPECKPIERRLSPDYQSLENQIFVYGGIVYKEHEVLNADIVSLTPIAITHEYLNNSKEPGIYADAPPNREQMRILTDFIQSLR